MGSEKYILDSRRVMNGTFGEVWFEGEYLAEAKGIDIKDEFNKEEINRVGTLRTGTKVTAISGKGSLTLFKIDSKVIKSLRDFTTGSAAEPRFVIMSRFADPDGLGVEQIVYKGVSFDDLTWIKSELKTVTEIEMPFTYDEVEIRELI